MKTDKNKGTSKNKKFSLEKMEVAKLKNMHLIIGGLGDDPIETTKTSKTCPNGSTFNCG
jgi:hypothetical protein